MISNVPVSMVPFKHLIQEAIGGELRRLRNNIKRHTRILRDLNGEIFIRNVLPDPEWEEDATEEAMVLENWRLWGQPGTGFEHLPALTRGQLFRADPEEEYESGDEEEEGEGEEEEEEEQGGEAEKVVEENAEEEVEDEEAGDEGEWEDEE